MSAIEEFKTNFEHKDFDMPVGATSYIEPDDPVINRVPAWRTCDRGVWTQDKHDRVVAVSEPKAWTYGRFMGISPLVLWERYSDREYPVMLWVPGAEDIVIPYECTADVAHFVTSNAGMTFDDDRGYTFTFASVENDYYEGVAYEEEGEFRVYAGGINILAVAERLQDVFDRGILSVTSASEVSLDV